MENNEKSDQYMKAKEVLIKLFDTIQKSTLDEIKTHLNELINANHTTIQGISQEFKEGKGKSLMHFAASRGDLAIFKYLVDNGAVLDQQDEAGNTPLFVAVQHENLDIIKYLIEEKNISVTESRNHGVTLLHLAASTGNKALVEYVLGKGANIEAVTPYGTPLQWAISDGKIEVSEYLLSKGANPNGASDKIVEVPPPLIMAVNHRSSKLFDLLLKHKADVNQRDTLGWDSLQFSAEIGELEFCKILLEKGVDPNYECQGQTALDLAFQNSQMECVSLLRPLTNKSIQSGVHRNRKDSQQAEDSQQVNEEEATLLKNKGNELFKEKKYAEALELYNQSLKFNHKTKAAAAVYTNKASCLLLLEKPEEALIAAQAAKALDRSWVKAYYREAQAYDDMKEYGECAASYFEALQLDPSNQEIKGHFERAIEKGKQAHRNKKL